MKIININVLAVFVAVALAGCGKPNLESSCVMNGMGEGICSFTNSGNKEGAMCGYIVVKDGEPGMGSPPLSSVSFCSGSVGEATTTQVEFSIPQVREFCSANGKSWKDVCSFEFRENGRVY